MVQLTQDIFPVGTSRTSAAETMRESKRGTTSSEDMIAEQIDKERKILRIVELVGAIFI